MGLPGDVVAMIDTYAACNSTPHHSAFAVEHGVRNVARLRACGPCFSDGYYRYEWSAAVPPFYVAPILSVGVAACLVDPCVLCCFFLVDAPACVRCSSRVCESHAAACSSLTLGVPVSPPIDLRGHMPVVLVRARAAQCLDDADVAVL